jgi:NAD(P)H-dependent FMN reductase
VYGSVRDGRLGIRLVKYLDRKLQHRGHHVVTVDPQVFELPILERRLTDYEVGAAPSAVEQVGDIFWSADAFLFVTGEYNYSVPPALVNIIDHYLEAYHHKIAAVASYSYGPFGGVRALEQLRSLLAGCGLVTAPKTLPVPTVQDIFNEEGHTENARLDSWVDGFLADFEWYAGALAAARSSSG